MEVFPASQLEATPPNRPQPRTSRQKISLEAGVGLVLRQTLRLPAGADLPRGQGLSPLHWGCSSTLIPLRPHEFFPAPSLASLPCPQPHS